MFKSRKIPQKVGATEDEEEPASESPFIRKKIAGSKVKKARVRPSFDAAQDGEDIEEDRVVSAVKKPSTSSRSGLSHGRVTSSRIPSDRLPLREIERDDHRPSYNSDYLAELKSSTPNKRPSVDSGNDAQATVTDLDIAAKFGAGALVAASHGDSVIPSAAEIREKKDRRRRLAREQDFISLDDRVHDDDVHGSDDDANPRSRSLIIPAEEISIQDKYGESRLVRDDEDFAEGFEEFVEDTKKVTLGKLGMKEQERQRRAEIGAQIRAAQGGGDDGDDADDNDVDEEEAARNAAYDETQARSGTYGSRTSAARSHQKSLEASLQKRLQNVPEKIPIPDWKSVMDRFNETLRQKTLKVELNKRRLEEVRKEREEIEEEESRVQALLKEAGEKLERAQSELHRSNTQDAILVRDRSASQGLEDLAHKNDGGGMNGDASSQDEGANELDNLRPTRMLGMAARLQEGHNDDIDDDDDDVDDDYY